MTFLNFNLLLTRQPPVRESAVVAPMQMQTDVDWMLLVGCLVLLITVGLALYKFWERSNSAPMSSEQPNPDEGIQQEEQLLAIEHVQQPAVPPDNQISAVYQCVPVEEIEDKASNFSGRIFLPQSLLSRIVILNEQGIGMTLKL